MTRVAAVDCGTNSLRLLIADVDVVAGVSTPLDRRTTIVRLGEGVDRTGVFAAAALERTFAAVDDYARVIASYGVEEVRFVATSAARDVGNRAELVEGVQRRLGVEPEVISGDEEARLSFDGAMAALAGLDWVAQPALVVDVGGGSTELATRTSRHEPVTGQSLDIGSVRLTERHLHDDPPSPAQVGAARADITEALDTLRFDIGAVGTVIGVAGTVTTMAAMVLDLPAYDRDAVDRARLPATALLRSVETIVSLTVAERESLPYMRPGRADVIAAGALVLEGVVRRTGCRELGVSVHDILDGIAWSLG